MNEWISKHLTVLTICIAAIMPSICAHGQDTGNSVSDSLRVEQLANEKYRMRMQRMTDRWMSLIPNKWSLQYAGDIGMFSIGLGWDYGSKNRWETHLFFGYLPRRHSTPESYFSFTVKENFTPWSIRINDRLSIEPLFGTFFINSIFSSDFWTSEPDRYPQGYYDFSTKIRFHIGYGHKITLHIPEHKRFLADRISLYYEISTCDLYVRQKIMSHNIPLCDIFCFAVGLQYTIM